MQQIGHLLKVGGHIGDVAPQVDIIELEVDDMLDAIGETALAVTLHCGRVAAERDGRQSRDSNRNHPVHLPRSPIRFCETARHRGGRGT